MIEQCWRDQFLKFNDVDFHTAFYDLRIGSINQRAYSLVDGVLSKLLGRVKELDFGNDLSIGLVPNSEALLSNSELRNMKPIDQVHSPIMAIFLELAFI